MSDISVSINDAFDHPGANILLRLIVCFQSNDTESSTTDKL